MNVHHLEIVFPFPQSLDENGEPALYDSPVSPPKLVPADERARSKNGAPVSLGSDQEATTWVNGCLRRLHEDQKAKKQLVQLWKDALIDYNATAGAEVGSFCFTFVIEVAAK